MSHGSFFSIGNSEEFPIEKKSSGGCTRRIVKKRQHEIIRIAQTSFMKFA